MKTDIIDPLLPDQEALIKDLDYLAKAFGKSGVDIFNWQFDTLDTIAKGFTLIFKQLNRIEKANEK